MLDSLPEELILYIAEQLDTLSLIHLQATSKCFSEIVSLESRISSYNHIVYFKTASHLKFLDDTNDFIDFILSDLQGKPEQFSIIRRYRMLSHFPEHVLTFIIKDDGDHMFHITPDEFLTESFEFLMLEACLGNEGNMIFTLHSERLDVPLFLLFLGVQVLVRMTACNTKSMRDSKKNFDIHQVPEWFHKALFKTNYSGLLLSELFSSTASITSTL